MKNNIRKLLYIIKYNVKESTNQEDLFTNNHTRYSVTIKYNNVTYSLDYQCPSDIIPTKEDILSCILSDSRCYEDAKVSDYDIDNLEEFMTTLGYTSLKNADKAYQGCKRAYTYLNKMFTKEEQEELFTYLEEKGLI